MFCPKCGQKIEEDCKFCENCGAGFEKDYVAKSIDSIKDKEDDSMSKTLTGGMTAIAVLNFVFGGISILIGHALMSRLAELSTVLILLLFLTIGYGIVGVIAGVGVLRLLPWGRTMSLVSAWVWIGCGVISLFTPSPQAGGKVAGAELAGKVIGFLLGLIYPVTLIFLFRRPSWRQTFCNQSQAQSGK